MNDNIMDSVDALLSSVNIEDMWRKFFEEVEFSDSFKQGVGAYKSLGEDIVSYEEDLSESIAQEWYSTYQKIKFEIDELNKNIDKIDKVLDMYELQDVEKQLLMEKKNQYEQELKNKPDEFKKLSIYEQQKQEKMNLIAQRTETQIGWKEYLEKEFNATNGVRSQLIVNAEYQRKKIDSQLERYNAKLNNLRNSLSFLEKQYNDFKVQYGEFNESTIKSAEMLNDKMAEIDITTKEMNKFKASIANFDVKLIQYLKFLKDMTFDEFWNQLSSRNFDLNFENKNSNLNVNVSGDNSRLSLGLNQVNSEVQESNNTNSIVGDDYAKGKESSGNTSLSLDVQEVSKDNFDNDENNLDSVSATDFQLPPNSSNLDDIQENDEVYLDAVKEATERQNDANNFDSIIDETEWENAYKNIATDINSSSSSIQPIGTPDDSATSGEENLDSDTLSENDEEIQNFDDVYLDAVSKSDERQREVNEVVSDYGLDTRDSYRDEMHWEYSNAALDKIELVPEFDYGRFTTVASNNFDNDIDPIRRRYSGDFDYDSYDAECKKAKRDYKEGIITKGEMKQRIKNAKEEFLSYVSDEQYLEYRDELKDEYDDNVIDYGSYGVTASGMIYGVNRINSDDNYNYRFQTNEKSRIERLTTYVKNNKKDLMKNFLLAVYKKLGYVEEQMNDEEYYEASRDGRTR